MIKEPEDEAFEEIEKAQQRKWGISLNTVRHPRGSPAPKEGLNSDSLETIELELPEREPLLVDKGCAERGCMGYDDRDGDKPVEMSIHRPWRGLTYEEETELIRLAHNHAGIRFYIQAAEAKLKELNT